jgi:excisionase family DNA binding protein
MSAPAQAASADKPLVPYLTAGQVAESLQVSIKSVYRWAKNDPTLPALKIGGTVRFPRERLERWLRDCEQGRPQLRRQVRSITESGISATRRASCADACADGAQE